MNRPTPPDPPATPPPASKLMIRSEILAIIRHLASLADPSRQEARKQLRKLERIEDRLVVQDILLKELPRAATPEALNVISQLLMEVGDIQYVQDRLWALIRSPQISDDVKDAANLILRQLGDESDPELYLHYLEDPKGLIGRETHRLLELSTQNPEALIDFIDFILSLQNEDQSRLLDSLQQDYPMTYLVNIFVPLLESDPSEELWQQLIPILGESRSPKAATSLQRLGRWPADRLPIPEKLLRKALKQLQIGGALTPTGSAHTLEQVEAALAMPDGEPYECFATLADGLGNQGLIFSRQRANGDISMMCVAVNDQHGILDCFGFYQLSPADFHRIVDKFHEAATKIRVPPGYCLTRLRAAEAINHCHFSRLPYEYGCWQVLLAGTEPLEATTLRLDPEWVRGAWAEETGNLYQHPDFNAWFLEQGDDPHVTLAMQQAVTLTEAVVLDAASDPTDYLANLDRLADDLMRTLLDSSWRARMIDRLEEAALLLDWQGTVTFRNLAATEAHKLQHTTDADACLDGFVRTYGRRCILEELLRLRAAAPEFQPLSPWVDRVITYWNL